MTDIPIITEKASDSDVIRRLETARWGLVPSWSKDPKAGARLINARSETVLEKPSFRKAAVKRRALVPADGYYEWLKDPDGSKTPIYCIQRVRGRGWASQHSTNSGPTRSCPRTIRRSGW